jgi:membrane-associated phospholipid phosphatase
VQPSFGRSRPGPIHFRRRRVLVDIARIFSTVCNPFVTAIVLYAILAHAYAHDTRTFWLWLFLSVFFSSIGPMLYVLWLYWTDRISDLDMSQRRERETVFSVFVLSYFVGTISLYSIHAPAMLVASMAGYTAAAFVVQSITRFWKISTHALGITAPLVALVVLYGQQPLPFAVLIPLVGWSRVYLKAHTTLQVIAGTLLGFISVYVFFRLFHVV